MKIDQIRSIVDAYFKEKGFPPQNIVGLVIEGSIPKGDYIDGWSDLDLVCLYDQPNQKDFLYMEDLNNYLIEKSGGLKSGIASLNYNSFIKSCEDVKTASMNIRFVKSFLYSYYPLSERIFYCKPGYTIPVLPRNIEEKVDATADVIYTVTYAYKFLAEAKNWQNKKSLTRKLIKMSISIIVDIDYLFEKKFIHNYAEAVKAFNTYKGDLDISILEKWFDKRFTWKDVKETDIPDNEIHQLQQLFFSLERKYYAIYNDGQA